MTRTFKIFDPAMCCSTGVCGPSVDPDLSRFAADLDWLKKQGVEVERFNLAQQPAAFAADEAVKSQLEEWGEGALPLIQVNGHIKSTGRYPSRDELFHWSGLPAETSVPKAAPTASCCSPKKSGGTGGGCC